MGVSTDGILVFGIPVGDDDERPAFLGDDEGFDFDDLVATEIGLKEPAHKNYKKDWPEYWAAKQKAEAEFAVTLVRHCSGEYTMYILGVTGTVTKASRGYPEVIDPATMTVAPEKIAALKAFCEKHKVEWSEPKWLLCSMWW